MGFCVVGVAIGGLTKPVVNPIVALEWLVWVVELVYAPNGRYIFARALNPI